MEYIASALFADIAPQDQTAVLHCIGYHIRDFEKGRVIAFEEERIRHVGIVLSGCVDTVKEDIWGNRTLLTRAGQGDLFGETFACGQDQTSVVTFAVSQAARVLFLPFDRVMKSCQNCCDFHHQLIRNMVRIIASKNRDLMGKLEVVSKRTIREKILAFLSLQAQLQGSRYIQVPFGRIEWAQYLCVDRSALTRELAKMKDEGLIDYDKNCFRLL